MPISGLPTFDTSFDDEPTIAVPAGFVEGGGGPDDDTLEDTMEDNNTQAKPAATSVEPVIAQEPTASAPAADDPYIPKVNDKFFDIPDGEPVVEDYAERNDGRMRPDVIQNSVDVIEDEDAFRKEAEAFMALQQGAPESNIADWIKKPDVWPSFIKFPSQRDLDAIRFAEQSGELDQDRMDKFNAHFEELSVMMQGRARQMDKWIFSENDAAIKSWSDRRNFFGKRPLIRKTLEDIRTERENADIEKEKAASEGREYSGKHDADPFCGIKWAVLLDPYASPDDPRFANVARFGHSAAVMHDGGQLRVDDSGMFIQDGVEATAMAGKMAVMEAIERGWTSINICGNEEFVTAAREAAIKAGLGAKVTTHYGLIGRGKTEYIMPNPPKYTGIAAPDDQVDKAHSDLTSGVGTQNGASKKSAPRKLATPGLAADPAAPGEKTEADALIEIMDDVSGPEDPFGKAEDDQSGPSIA